MGLVSEFLINGVSGNERFILGFAVVFFAKGVDDFGSWGNIMLKKLCFNGVVNWVWLYWWSYHARSC